MNLGMLKDGTARFDFVQVDFEKGRRAALVEYVADDAHELVLVISDGGGLVDH